MVHCREVISPFDCSRQSNCGPFRSDSDMEDGRESPDDGGWKRKWVDTMDKTQRHLTQVRDSIHFAKNCFNETCNQIENLQSSLAELKSIAEAGMTSSSSGCQESRRRSPEITSQRAESVKKKLKTCPLSGTTSSSRPPSEEVPEPGVEDTDTVAVRVALDMTNGILQPRDLHMYLYLTSQVEDPLQLAKISFTTDLRKLYYQLLAFLYHLRNANDVIDLEAEGPALEADRRLEDRLKVLIEYFKVHLLE